MGGREEKRLGLAPSLRELGGRWLCLQSTLYFCLWL